MNSNGWRTAHNVPTEALLDAADEMGFLVWDENHRNGQDSEVGRCTTFCPRVNVKAQLRGDLTT